MRSLVGTIVVGLVLSLAAVFTVQWWAVRITIDREMNDIIASELAQDADELFTALVLPNGQTTSIGLSHFDPSFLTPQSGRYYQVMIDRDIVLRSPSLVYDSLPVVAGIKGQRAIRHVAGPIDQNLLMSTIGYERGGRAVTIAVAADLKPLQNEFDQFLWRYTLLSIAMFALLVVLQIVIVRVVLFSLRRVEMDVIRLERGEVRQLGTKVPSEVLPLVREVNRLIALLAERLKRSRESLGNLAHALKTPLTVLTQIANDEHIQRNPALASELSEQLGIVRVRIDNELRRARVAGGRAIGSMIDPSTEIATLVKSLQKLYQHRNLDVACHIEPHLRFHGDREDLLELCGNLLDNACKWASSRVLISAHDGKGLVVIVEDDGPGCSADELRHIAQRGVRFDEATQGHGLGLSIASSIASSYGATIQFGRSDSLGGFCATVTFPVR